MATAYMITTPFATEATRKLLGLTPEQFAIAVEERKAALARGECDHGIKIDACQWCRSIPLTPRR